MSGVVACPKCKTPLPTSATPEVDLAPCIACGNAVQAFAFPALGRSLGVGSAGQAIVAEGEASCFYHPQKRSVVPCSACGRFLCALCDVNLDGQHLCPGCLESGQRKGKLQSIEHRRALYDNMALGIALLPLLFWPMTIVTAPIAIVCAILWRNRQSSILPRSRVRFLLAIVFSLAQILIWAGAIFAMMRS